MSNQKKKSKLDILKNPWICFGSIGLGIFIGQMWNGLGMRLAVPGDLYLSMLKMSVIPIISTAIVIGLARMLRSGAAGQYLKQTVWIFMIMVLIGSALGMLAGFVGKPGVNLGKASEAFLGKALMGATASGPSESTGLWDVIIQMIPVNVFSAFSTGKVLSVIFVSVMVGLATGLVQNKNTESFLHFIQGVNDAFSKILGWVLYGLPFGLACLMAGMVATIGIDTLLALGKFIIVFYISGLVLCTIYLLMIKISTGQSFIKILSAIWDPLFVSFSAASCIAPLPIALKNMEEKLGQPHDVANFLIPLGATINRHSYALLFSFTAVFLAQLFGKTLSIGQCLTVFLASALVGTAAAGRLAAVAPMLAYILAPIGVPLSVGMTVFLSVGAILDPMVQMNILFGSCANAAVVAKTGKREVSEHQDKISVETQDLSRKKLNGTLEKQVDNVGTGSILPEQGQPA